MLDEIVHKAVEAWAKLDENALQNQLIEARADAPVAEKVWRFYDKDRGGSSTDLKYVTLTMMDVGKKSIAELSTQAENKSDNFTFELNRRRNKALA